MIEQFQRNMELMMQLMNQKSQPTHQEPPPTPPPASVAHDRLMVTPAAPNAPHSTPEHDSNSQPVASANASFTHADSEMFRAGASAELVSRGDRVAAPIPVYGTPPTVVNHSEINENLQMLQQLQQQIMMTQQILSQQQAAFQQLQTRILQQAQT
jgi:hypothetical protein